VGALGHARDESLPDAGARVQRQRHRSFSPPFEVADHGDAGGVGRPDRELHAGLSLSRLEVGAQPLVGAPVRSFGEQMEVDVSEIAHR
jgi:hypothetical protein